MVESPLGEPLGDLSTESGVVETWQWDTTRCGCPDPPGARRRCSLRPIGLVTTAALKACGAGQVIVVEPAGARKQKAPAAGADTVLDPTETDVPEAIRDLTGGAGADVAFECAGIDRVLASAIASVRPGGTVVNVALGPRGPAVAVKSWFRLSRDRRMALR